MSDMPSISVVVTRYNEPNSLVHPCLIALSKQEKIKSTILFLDQRFDTETRLLCKQLSGQNNQLTYSKIPARSLSYARNLGIKKAKTELVLFTDSDAIPDSLWAFESAKTFEINSKIAIVGGKSTPIWFSENRWYHRSNIALEQYSLLDLSRKCISTDKVVGVNFSIHKKRLGALAHFEEGLGRKKGKLFGGEETQMCRLARNKGLEIYYNPNAIVSHQIPVDRMNLRWLLKRMYYGGMSRAKRGGAPKTFSKKRNIYDYLFLAISLPFYLSGYMRGKLEKSY